MTASEVYGWKGVATCFQPSRGVTCQVSVPAGPHGAARGVSGAGRRRKDAPDLASKSPQREGLPFPTTTAVGDCVTAPAVFSLSYACAQSRE